MKTNFYLADFVLSNCVPIFRTFSTGIVIILNGEVAVILHEESLFNIFLHLKIREFPLILAVSAHLMN